MLQQPVSDHERCGTAGGVAVTFDGVAKPRWLIYLSHSDLLYLSDCGRYT